jgi:hypothetical protein
MGAKHPTHRIIRASVFPSYRHREGSRIHPALNAEIPQEIESKFRRGFQPRAFVWSHTTMPSAMDGCPKLMALRHTPPPLDQVELQPPPKHELLGD